MQGRTGAPKRLHEPSQVPRTLNIFLAVLRRLGGSRNDGWFVATCSAVQRLLKRKKYSTPAAPCVLRGPAALVAVLLRRHGGPTVGRLGSRRTAQPASLSAANRRRCAVL